MRILTAFCAAIMLISLLAVSAFAQTATLTGKMAPFTYLVGTTWNCDVNVPAMMGQAAHATKSTVTFNVAPNNVMHVHVGGTEYNADQYFGYSTQQNMYWSTTAGSTGMAVTQVSNDGRTYTGSAPMGSMTVAVRDTYAKGDNPNTMTFQETATVNGKDYVTNGACTR